MAVVAAVDDAAAVVVVVEVVSVLELLQSQILERDQA